MYVLVLGTVDIDRTKLCYPIGCCSLLYLYLGVHAMGHSHWYYCMRSRIGRSVWRTNEWMNQSIHKGPSWINRISILPINTVIELLTLSSSSIWQTVKKKISIFVSFKKESIARLLKGGISLFFSGEFPPNQKVSVCHTYSPSYIIVLLPPYYFTAVLVRRSFSCCDFWFFTKIQNNSHCYLF